MSFLGDIDRGLQKLNKTTKEDAYIDTTCVNCGEPMKVHRMRARHGTIRCPNCKEIVVMMMRRGKE